MRILSVPFPAQAPAPGAPSAITETPPGADSRRVAALENTAGSLANQIARLEERIAALEKHPRPAAPAAAPATPAPKPLSVQRETPLAVDTGAFKKGLTQMWKHLNDQDD